MSRTDNARDYGGRNGTERSSSLLYALRRKRYAALHWLLAHTQTGRAILWNEWLNGRDWAKQQAEWADFCDEADHYLKDVEAGSGH